MRNSHASNGKQKYYGQSCKRRIRKNPAPNGYTEEFREEIISKETGETAHVERWNCTLRQRFSRFVRKTPSFSKNTMMYTIYLDLFLHRDNMERATLLG